MQIKRTENYRTHEELLSISPHLRDYRYGFISYSFYNFDDDTITIDNFTDLLLPTDVDVIVFEPVEMGSFDICVHYKTFDKKLINSELEQKMLFRIYKEVEDNITYYNEKINKCKKFLNSSGYYRENKLERICTKEK